VTGSAAVSQSLREHLRACVADVRARERYRRRRVITGEHGVRAVCDGRTVLNFCSNDYLGLATHPEVRAALRRGVDRLGVGSGASQLITGHNAEHAALEAELADWVGRERALLFGTGYAANMGVIAALMGKRDTIVSDALNHASLIDGARLSGAAKAVYRHGDPADAGFALARADAGHRLLLTDAVFSMDGDRAPLAALARTAREHDAWLMADDAHGLGVLGPRGAGAVAEAGLDATEVPILVGTLGKSLGTAGAFVAGDAALIEYLLQSARTFIFSTAPPPAVAAATRTALGIARDDEGRRERLRALIGRFRRGAAELGISLGTSHISPLTSQVSTPIQPLILGDEASAMAVSDALLERGYLVGAIRPPTVPAGTSRLRITLSAVHSEADVDGLLDALAHALAGERHTATA